MKRAIVRLQNIEIRNLKNVGNGYVKFTSHNDKADILGIYGQNGSGRETLSKTEENVSFSTFVMKFNNKANKNDM